MIRANMLPPEMFIASAIAGRIARGIPLVIARRPSADEAIRGDIVA
jgi:hypothetical protein